MNNFRNIINNIMIGREGFDETSVTDGLQAARFNLMKSRKERHRKSKEKAKIKNTATNNVSVSSL